MPAADAGTLAGASARVDSVTARACTVPTDAPEADGTLSWEATSLVVVTVSCDGIDGLGWSYGPPACAGLVDQLLRDVVLGSDPMDVAGTWSRMVATARNAPRVGAVGYAISAVDVALWDLKARLLGISLSQLFGRVHTTVPVYGSGGFTTYSDERMVDQLTGWTSRGIEDVKIKIGQDRGRTERRDLHRIELARESVGPTVGLFVDANGAYGRKQAVRVLAAASEARVSWFEEPVSSDDLDGLRAVREGVDADVTAGEYGTDVYYFRRMCAAGAVDCLQVDATRCGGYSEWLRAAAVAASFGLEVSAHCAPNLHAHVAAATPNLRHLEWFHDHVRVESRLFSGCLQPEGGRLRPDAELCGHGLRLDLDRAAEYDANRST